MDKNNKWKNKWSVFKENNLIAHICVLIVAVNVLFILGSGILISVLPEHHGRSIPEILRLAFTLMVNPSGKYVYGETPASLIITTVVVLLGMISLTGGTVGFISSVITGILDKAAHSQKALKLSGHIVILNYNRRVPAILCDYCYDDMDSTYIVILTERDKDAVLHEIDEMYNRLGMEKRFKNVIVRTGNPMSNLDLERAAVGEAETVILMTPEAEDSGAQSREESGFAVSKLFLFVTSYLGGLNKENEANIIVETFGSGMDEMVREYRLSTLKHRAVSVEYSRLIGKVLGITAIMPAANETLNQLFSFEGAEVYLNPVPERTIREELARSRSVLPLFDSNGLRAYVAEDESEFGHFAAADYQLKKPLPAQPIVPNITFDKNEITIVGINDKLPHILESLACFRREYNNEKLHVILADTAERMEEMQAFYRDPAYAEILQPEKYSPVLIRSLYHPMDDLAGIVDSSADTLMFLSEDDCADSRTDEKPLLYWSGIRGHIDDIEGPDVVVELQKAENQSVLRQKNKDQILVSEDFLGHLYAQLGKNPLRLNVIMDLISSEGDTASVNTENDMQNEGDLLSVKAGTLFSGGDYDLTFTSKRELILWIYDATGGRVLPIGVAKGGKSYLFSRTESSSDGLDSCVLLGINEGDRYEANPTSITLEPKDELIFLAFS